ncbi:MAG: hypothetical protein BWY57_01611 [Betaproteobacteria bacterium ADurb.Bin341]|nr:MAG: hypothetical protein BWY57_01611 [Betaproteobacteria bacterium ADurb.Bin341]
MASAADAAFERMHNRLFAHLGRQATLQGIDCLAMIEHGVATTGEYGEVTGRVSVATVRSGLNPKLGNTLVIDGESYVLDQLLKNDGDTAEFMVRRA